MGDPFVRQGDVLPTPSARALLPTSLPLIRHLGSSGAEDLLLDPAGRELSDFHPPWIAGSRLKAPLLARPLLETANWDIGILLGSLLMSHTQTFLTRPARALIQAGTLSRDLAVVSEPRTGPPSPPCPQGDWPLPYLSICSLHFPVSLLLSALTAAEV